MKVLIACEESQTVCKAFRARGHEAYSCDIQKNSGGMPGWHILMDALAVINGGTLKLETGQRIDVDHWDLIIAHPPCTYLTNAATRHHSRRMTPVNQINARTLPEQWLSSGDKKKKGGYQKMDEYILNACGKILPWKRFLSSADPLVYDKTLVDLASRNVEFSTQGVFDRYCNLYYREYGSQDPINLEEPYKPSAADLDDFAEFQAERNPMFEDFNPDQYDF